MFKSRITNFSLMTTIVGGALAGFTPAKPANALAFSYAVYYEPPHIPSSYDIYAIEVSTNTDAQTFIDKMSTDAIAFLGNNSYSQTEKKKKFKSLLEKNFDMETIGRFVMGPKWKQMTDAQKTEYQKLFNDLIVNIYAERFSEYDGQKLVVESARHDNKDYIVQSKIVSPDGQQKIPVSWRVRDKNGTKKIVDVSIKEVSMAISKKSEFASIIQRGGGDPEVLLKHLRDKAG